MEKGCSAMSSAIIMEAKNRILDRMEKESMSCHVCVYSGVKTCNAEEAELKCLICGRCEAEKAKEVADGRETDKG